MARLPTKATATAAAIARIIATALKSILFYDRKHNNNKRDDSGISLGSAVTEQSESTVDLIPARSEAASKKRQELEQ